MTLRIGELFAGYGGLGMAVQQVYGGDVAWYSEFDDAPSRIMARHHPGVPNYGDVTQIDWSTVEPVDILTGGFPCQDVSVAGRRAGMTDGTRSGLWSHMAHAIDVLRPPLVVIENVGGLFSAEATRVMESHPLCLGDGGTGSDTVLLRAIDAVLSTLSELGYDAEWTALRAADVGAPHGRLRVFITAHPAEDTSGSGGGRWSALPLAGGAGGADAPTVRADDRPDASGSAPRLMPTPRATDGTKGGPNQRGSSGDLMLPSAVAQLLPTPMVGSTSPAAHGQISGDYRRRMDEALEQMPSALIPTPSVADATGGHERRGGARGDELLLKGLAKEGHLERFGPYAPVIARWEQILGRPAPDPTEINPDKRKRCAVHAVPPEAGPGEGLRDVRDTAEPQAVREREARGSRSVPAQAALLPLLREHEEGSREGDAPLASPEAPETGVRGVRGDDGSARTSPRPEPREQRPDESGDPMRELPSQEALAGGPREEALGESVGAECTCGRPRLSSAFVEFLMGLDDGHVTEVGLTRNQELKALGNGVVPQQGAAALRHLDQIRRTS